MNKTVKNNLIVITISAIIIILCSIFIFSDSNEQYINYIDFKNMIESGEIKSALIESKYVKFSKISGDTRFYTDNPESTNFKEYLLLNNVSLEDNYSEDMIVVFDVLFYVLFFTIMGFAIYKFSQTFGGTKFKVIKKTNTTFEDICGMEEIKKDMSKTVDLLKHPEEYKAKGIRAPKGIILEGPPGNGKTLFAKALATEVGINFIPTKGADFQSALMSLGPRSIRSLFKKARKNKPCIIFIDEFDSIGERRNYTGTGIDKENNRMITAMLNEMDGFENESGVLVVAATNSYNSLDAALIRPGRFDKKFKIDNPDLPTIKELIDMYTKDKRLSDSINLNSLCKCFNGLSCSSIETLLNEANLCAKINDREEITLEDIIEAGKKTNIINIKKL